MNKKNNGVNVVVYLIITFIAFCLGGICMYMLNMYAPVKVTTKDGVQKTVNSGTVIINDGSLSPSVEKVYDAVVMVESFARGSIISTGSGFVYKQDSKYGYIMTNHHVINGAEKIVLVRSDDVEIDGTLLGSDEYLDLAVIRVNKSDILDVCSIGKSDDSKIGDTVFTVGSPLGYEYRGTVTDGILAGKNRMVSVAVNSQSSEDWVMKVLQTNAAVNPGNSGGPLVNANGEVIGIISIKLVQTSVENMGFAIPIEDAMTYIEMLEGGKAITRPMIGISMLNLTEASYYYRNFDTTLKNGVYVAEISPNSGASKSDLKKGDIITKLNGNKIDNVAYLRYELYKCNIGDTITVTYIRDGKEYTTKVTLTEYRN